MGEKELAIAVFEPEEPHPCENCSLQMDCKKRLLACANFWFDINRHSGRSASGSRALGTTFANLTPAERALPTHQIYRAVFVDDI